MQYQLPVCILMTDFRRKKNTGKLIYLSLIKGFAQLSVFSLKSLDVLFFLKNIKLNHECKKKIKPNNHSNVKTTHQQYTEIISYRVGHSSQFDDRLHSRAAPSSCADTWSSVFSFPLPPFLWGSTGGRGTAGVCRTLLSRHPQIPNNSDTSYRFAEWMTTSC